MMRKICIAIIAALTSAATPAFSVLGPYASWMNETNLTGAQAIGGAMDIGEEYRWNLSTITYGFDQAFLSRFGIKGALAIESAMNILNRLPPASDSFEALERFPLRPKRLNFQAARLGLEDLGSTALVAVLEQLGVANPVNNMYRVRDFVLTDSYTNALVILRNFDPITLAPSYYVNGIRYAYELAVSHSQNLVEAYAMPVDPVQPYSTAAAGSRLLPGEYFSSLSRDDAGALFFLFSPENRQIEELPADIQLPITGSFFQRRAYRPGINKLKFVSIPFDPLTGQFGPATYKFEDAYFESGILRTQLVQRIVTRPDIVFSADDLGFDANGAPWFRSSTAKRWINNAGINGNFNGLGPGVIPPGATISFNRSTVIQEDGTPAFTWGSFDGTTNAPIQLFSPPMAGLKMAIKQSATNSSIHIDGESGIDFTVQISKDLGNWITLLTVTNFSGHREFPFTIEPSRSEQFYRLTLE